MTPSTDGARCLTRALQVALNFSIKNHYYLACQKQVQNSNYIMRLQLNRFVFITSLNERLPSKLYNTPIIFNTMQRDSDIAKSRPKKEFMSPGLALLDKFWVEFVKEEPFNQCQWKNVENRPNAPWSQNTDFVLSFCRNYKPLSFLDLFQMFDARGFDKTMSFASLSNESGFSCSWDISPSSKYQLLFSLFQMHTRKYCPKSRITW